MSDNEAFKSFSTTNGNVGSTSFLESNSLVAKFAFLILVISFSMASVEPETSALSIIGIIFLLVSIYFSIYFEVMPILSIVVLVIFSILTFGIYKKYHHAKYLLLLLYFIIPMLSLIVAPFSKFGWFWSFGFFYVFDSILIERINFKYNLKQVSE